MAKRERPEGGGIVWREELNAFECYGCGEFISISRRRQRENPEHLATMRELLVIEHTECWEYDDPRMAKLARRFRKEAKRQKNLAAQRVSWQGRRV